MLLLSFSGKVITFQLDGRNEVLYKKIKIFLCVVGHAYNLSAQGAKGQFRVRLPSEVCLKKIDKVIRNYVTDSFVLEIILNSCFFTLNL